MENTAQRIKELMEHEGLSNSEFAKKLDLNPAIISHILSGRNKPSLQVIETIKSVFTNVNLDYLITGSGGLTQPVTNVKPDEFSEITQSSGGGFPMEGVRVAAVPGSTDLRTPPPPNATDDEEKEEEVKPVSPATQSEKTEIEQIVIFYKDGSFKAYRP